MDQHFELVAPDPWDDPEFASRRRRDPKSRPRRVAWRVQDRVGVLGLALAVVWLGLLIDPLVRSLVLNVLIALTLTLGVVVGAMGLGWIGTGLFAVGDRFVAWLRAGSQWPEE